MLLMQVSQRVSQYTKFVFVFSMLAISPRGLWAAEVIHDIAVEASVRADRHMQVTQTMVYDFGSDIRHGVTLLVPRLFIRADGPVPARVHIIQALLDGQPIAFTHSRIDEGQLVSIGDPNLDLNGVHTFQLLYETDRAVATFSDHATVQWNVTGDVWSIPVEHASFALSLPDVAMTSSSCTTSMSGSQDEACRVTSDGRSILVETIRVLQPHEALLATIEIPSGVIHPPSIMGRLWMFLQDHGELFFPLFALLIMSVYWWFLGRDLCLGRIVPISTPPQDFGPGLLGAMLHEDCVSPSAFTATLIDLAERGYVRLRKGGGISSAQVIRDADRTLRPYERVILEGIMAAAPVHLVQGLFRTQLQAELARRPLFDEDPILTREAYAVVAFVLTFGLYVAFGSTNLGTISALLTGGIVVGIGWLMPRKTRQGIAVMRRLRGFQKFLSSQKTELYLPYAVALGVRRFHFSTDSPQQSK